MVVVVVVAVLAAAVLAAVRPISLIRISLIRFQGLDLKKKSPINDQKLCVLSSDSHGKLRFCQGLDRKSGNVIKEIARTQKLMNDVTTIGIQAVVCIRCVSVAPCQ